MIVCWLFLLSLTFRIQKAFEYDKFKAIYEGENYGPIMQLSKTVLKDGESLQYTCYITDGNANWLQIRRVGAKDFENYASSRPNAEVRADEEACPGDVYNYCTKIHGNLAMTRNLAGNYRCSAIFYSEAHSGFSVTVYWYNEDVKTESQTISNSTVGNPLIIMCNLTFSPMDAGGINNFDVTWEHIIPIKTRDYAKEWVNLNRNEMYKSYYTPMKPSPGSSSYKLRINSFTPWRDGGEYRCKVNVPASFDFYTGPTFALTATPLVSIKNSKNRGDFTFAYGENVNITCIVHSHPREQDAYFTLNGATINKIPGAKSNVEIVRDTLNWPTTITMTIQKVDNLTESLLANSTLSCTAMSHDGKLSVAREVTFGFSLEPILDNEQDGNPPKEKLAPWIIAIAVIIPIVIILVIVLLVVSYCRKNDDYYNSPHKSSERESL